MGNSQTQSQGQNKNTDIQNQSPIQFSNLNAIFLSDQQIQHFFEQQKQNNIDLIQNLIKGQPFNKQSEQQNINNTDKEQNKQQNLKLFITNLEPNLAPVTQNLVQSFKNIEITQSIDQSDFVIIVSYITSTRSCWDTIQQQINEMLKIKQDPLRIILWNFYDKSQPIGLTSIISEQMKLDFKEREINFIVQTIIKNNNSMQFTIEFQRKSAMDKKQKQDQDNYNLVNDQAIQKMQNLVYKILGIQGERQQQINQISTNKNV